MSIIKLCLVAAFFGVVTSNPIQQRKLNHVTFNFTNFNFKDFIPRNDLRQLRGTSRVKQVAVMNDYVDKFLIELNAYLMAEGVEPITLPDQGGEVGWSIFTAEMSLKNGWLKGISTLKRNGDVTVSYQHPLVKLRLPLRIQDIMINYDYAVQLMSIGPSGVLDGSIKGCQFLLQIELDVTTMFARLGQYDLQDLGDLSLKFHGGILEWMVNIMLPLAVSLIKPVLHWFIEDFTYGSASNFIETYNGIINGLLENAAS